MNVLAMRKLFGREAAAAAENERFKSSNVEFVVRGFFQNCHHFFCFLYSSLIILARNSLHMEKPLSGSLSKSMKSPTVVSNAFQQV